MKTDKHQDGTLKGQWSTKLTGLINLTSSFGVCSAEVGVKTSRARTLSPYLQMELRQTNVVSVRLCF